MNALVGYGSSDEEEDEVNTSPERPAKIAKLDHNAPDHLTAALPTPTAHPEAKIETQPLRASTINPPPTQDAPPAGPTIPAPGPALNEPTATATVAAPATATPPSQSTSTPFSPYTFTRQRLRDLTMPPVPSFAIPDAPPPPATNSEEAAILAAATKQFERFLALKAQGVHFNERLQKSTSLRNPSLLPKLMAFADVGAEESYESTLADELGVPGPGRWPGECFVENLVKTNERRERKRVAERERVDFVPSRVVAEGSASASGKSTPGDGKRRRFDRK